MKMNSYRDRLVLLGLILVFVNLKNVSVLEAIGGVFLIEFLVETGLLLWSAASIRGQRK